jgi:hypothetical protein
VFAVEDSDEGGGVRSISSLPPLSCAFVLPSETCPIIAHIVPNMPALAVNVCQATGLLLLSPCSQLPSPRPSTHSCGNNVAEHLKTTLKTTSQDGDISLSAANLPTYELYPYLHDEEPDPSVAQLIPCKNKMPLACFIRYDRRRQEPGPSVRRDSLPLFVDLCLKANLQPIAYMGIRLIMTTQQGAHQAWTGQINLPNALQYT